MAEGLQRYRICRIRPDVLLGGYNVASRRSPLVQQFLLGVEHAEVRGLCRSRGPRRLGFRIGSCAVVELSHSQRAFILNVAKNGPKLVAAPTRDCAEAPSTPRPCHVFHGGPARGAIGKTVNMADLADYLTFLGQPVVDRTGIRGDFDIDVPASSLGHVERPTPD